MHAAKACQVNGSFGVSGSTQYALVLGIEGIDVSGTSEVLRLGVGIGQCANCGGTVVCAHSSGATFQQVYRNGEWCAQHAGVVLYLVFQFQFLGTAHGDGGAEYASSVLEHEVYLLWCNQFGCGDEVAFVLAVFIVHNYNKLTLFEVLERVLDGTQCNVVTHISCLLFCQ